jgi:hypothetical protein
VVGLHVSLSLITCRKLNFLITVVEVLGALHQLFNVQIGCTLPDIVTLTLLMQSFVCKKWLDSLRLILNLGN